MAEVNAKDLTTKTTPASTDSMLLFGTTSNEGAKITVDNLADNILGRLTTKTFANQVGGSSAATLLAQLSTLNSNMTHTTIVSWKVLGFSQGNTWTDTGIVIHTTKKCFIFVESGYNNTYPTAFGFSFPSAASAYLMKCAHSNPSPGSDKWLTYVTEKTDYKLWVKSAGSQSDAFPVRIIVIGDPNASAELPS